MDGYSLCLVIDLTHLIAHLITLTVGMQSAHHTTFSLKQCHRTEPPPLFIPNGSGRDGFHKLVENSYGKGQNPITFSNVLRSYGAIDNGEYAINRPPSSYSKARLAPPSPQMLALKKIQTQKSLSLSQPR